MANFPDEKREMIDRKLRAVAIILGMEFDEEYAASDRYDYHAKLNNGQGSLIFSIPSYPEKYQDRVRLFGRYPTDKNHEVMSHHSHAITFAAYKTSKQMARDIQKRFLPKYQEILFDRIRAVEAANKYHADREKTLAHIAQAFEIQADGEKSLSLYDVTGHQVWRVEAYSDNKVRFEVTTTPLRAENIIRYLKTEYEKEKADEEKKD